MPATIIQHLQKTPTLKILQEKCIKKYLHSSSIQIINIRDILDNYPWDFALNRLGNYAFSYNNSNKPKKVIFKLNNKKHYVSDQTVLQDLYVYFKELFDANCYYAILWPDIDFSRTSLIDRRIIKYNIVPLTPKSIFDLMSQTAKNYIYSTDQKHWNALINKLLTCTNFANMNQKFKDLENIYHVAIIKPIIVGQSVKNYQYFARALYEFLPLTWTYQELTKSKTISYQKALAKIDKVPNPSEKYACDSDYDTETFWEHASIFVYHVYLGQFLKSQKEKSIKTSKLSMLRNNTISALDFIHETSATIDKLTPNADSYWQYVSDTFSNPEFQTIFLDKTINIKFSFFKNMRDSQLNSIKTKFAPKIKTNMLIQAATKNPAKNWLYVFDQNTKQFVLLKSAALKQQEEDDFSCQLHF